MPDKAVPAALRAVLSRARYEVLPTPAISDAVAAAVPPGRTVTVTSSARLGLEATLATAVTLQAGGYQAVPHVAARLVSGAAELREIVDRLLEAGIEHIFVPGGDESPPVGEYHSALQLLQDLDAMGRPFADVGMAGYPEPHPVIPDAALEQALVDKSRYATNVVSNLCFDPRLVDSWARRLRAQGMATPLLIGMAGPVERRKLLRIATNIGVGDSTKFLAKNKNLFARILTPGGYSPKRFLFGLQPLLETAGAAVDGLHLYTFNQVAETEKFRRELLERLTG